MAVDPRFAIVTPSYWRDVERCALLVESIARCGIEAEHYLIVDHCDAALFRPLVGGRTRLIESEELIEPWLRRLPGRRGYWWSFSTPPVRGWILQQILKIAAAQVIDVPTLVYCDSDTTFIKPFVYGTLLVDGRVGLLDYGYVDDNTRTWTRVARRLLGLPIDAPVTRGHVGNMICWQRDQVLAMRSRVAEATGMSWQRAIARERRFSEYILYGVHVREAVGYPRSEQHPSTVPLTLANWGLDLSSPSAIDGFFDEISPQTVALMIHSKKAADQAYLRRKFEDQWGKPMVTSSQSR